MAVPQSALEVLSLASAKRQLRLDLEDGDTSYDEELTGHIQAAVSWVERHTQLPILAKLATPTARARDRSPLRFYCLGGYGVVDNPGYDPRVAIRYWSDEAAWRAGEPNRGIAADTLGRVTVGGPPWYGFSIFPPPTDASGWPEAWRDVFEVTVQVGTDIDYTPGLVSAVVVGARMLFDGTPEIKPTNTLLALCAAYRNFAAGVDD